MTPLTPRPRRPRLFGLVAAPALALGGLLAGEPPARADASGPPDERIVASMACDRTSEPGRVRCTLEARPTGGRTIAWGDVEIVSLPDFATALKGRIGPQDATEHEPASYKWAFGLVAKRAGQGEARARVRVVACEGERCAPVVVEVRAAVVVGS